MSTRLQALDAHPAFYLLSKCLFIPKLLYTLRSAPCHNQTDSLIKLDVTLRSCVQAICNINPDDMSWQQLTLPVRYGGLNLTSQLDVALPAYLSSISAGEPLLLEILSNFFEFSPVQRSDTAFLKWSEYQPTFPDAPYRQRAWCDILYGTKSTLLTETMDQHRLACLRAGSEPHSGACLQALPSAQTGTLLDNDSMRIGLCLRLGIPLCVQHRCRCGGIVDEFGLHPLSCRFSSGRLPRHAALNDTIKRALASAGFPSTLEPIGLDRGDDKRPDGITFPPFEKGKCLVWDATCTDTFSPGRLNSSATSPGSAAKSAENLKLSKYSSLLDRYHFVPFAVETSGVIGPMASALLKKIGSLISVKTGNSSEGTLLYQRISIAIIRGNAAAITAAGREKTASDTHLNHLFGFLNHLHRIFFTNCFCCYS